MENSLKHLIRVYIGYQNHKTRKNIKLPSYPLSVAKLHQNHLRQQHLLTYTAYTIIATNKQIGWT